ncbi:MAG: PorV/PorQ family protein [Bacteroidetes bacterium]|nr:PorV/PorQ family protein [Bacteroidota bacterium]
MKRLLLLLTFLPALLFAQNAGEAGFSFLKIGFGARNISLGDLGVVGINDVSAVNYNPAVVNDLNNTQIIIGHNSYIQDMNSEIMGASFRMFGLPFAITVNTTSINDIEIHSGPWQGEGTFNANYFFTGISTGFELNENISTGITVKYLYENLFSDESGGYGFDIGLRYSNVIKNLNLGASLRNLGSVNELRNKVTKLPVDFRIGASYSFNLKTVNSELLLLSGFQKYTAVDNSHIHVGAEFLYNNLISIRAGYITGYEAKDLTAGFGINWNLFNFDYAFSNFTYNLGSAHTISVMYTFQ